METAAELIMHPAAGHGSKRVQRHLQRFIVAVVIVVPQQKLERHRTRKLGRAAEAAMNLVVAAAEIVEGGVENGLVERLPGMSVRNLILKLFEDLVAGFDDAVAIVLPGIRNPFEQRLE